MTILGKIKIIKIIGFGIYLILGFTIPWVFAYFFHFLPYENNEYIVAIIYLIIGGFVHFGFKNIARKIGLINKRKIYWLEWTLTISALFLWIFYTFVLLVKYYQMNS